ncbi:MULTISPECIES: hypothetical protein [Haloferax]|uniref:hypothetical protein n=1 Tax=Haloferax TaxID=2251 RepID=UPI000A663F4D|nr:MULTISPECIES: hypothetical protein [Haloferax]
MTPSELQRRESAVATCNIGLGSVAALSGCLTVEGVNGGVLTVMHIPSPEAAEIVSASDERLDGAELILRALDRVTQRDPYSVMDFRLARDEYAAVAAALEDLPYYDRSEHEASIPSGYYVSHGEFVYRLAHTPLCSDTPLVSADDSRNRCWTSVPEVPEDATTL